MCHICSSIAPGSQQTTRMAWCCAKPLGPATSSVRRTGSNECSMHASIDAERMEEQVEGAAHHHPPVGVSSVSRDHFFVLSLPFSRTSSYEASEWTGVRAWCVGAHPSTRRLRAATTARTRGTKQMNAFCGIDDEPAPPLVSGQFSLLVLRCSLTPRAAHNT